MHRSFWSLIALSTVLLVGGAASLAHLRLKPTPAAEIKVKAKAFSRGAHHDTDVEHGRLRFVAVGDIIPHYAVKNVAAAATGGFAGLWPDLVPLFEQADLVFGNVETPIAPRTGRAGRAFVFNAPADLPAALRATGFDLVSLANNHAFDQGAAGLTETLDRLRRERLHVVGAGRTKAEAEQTSIVTRNGIRVATLAFSDLLNIDLNRKAQQPWVRRLDLAPAVAAVTAAKKQADVVVVSVHWGNEYQTKPSPRQRRIARQLVVAGADVIVGHHPHVLQPLEVMREGGRKAVVAYSLGNFVSNQAREYVAANSPRARGDRRDSAALVVSFAKVRAGGKGLVTLIDDVGYEPLWCRNEGQGVSRRIRVVPIAKAIDDVLARLDRATAGQELATGKAAQLVVSLQEELRTLMVRKERITEVMGATLGAPSSRRAPRPARGRPQ